MGTAFCCTLLVTCLPKAFHDGSAKFTNEDFECMVCLKKFTLQKLCREIASMRLHGVLVY